MAKLRIKKNTKNIILIILACVLTFGAIFSVVSLFKASEEDIKTINPTYAVGGLTENGKYLETEESIYTKDAFECQGLTITPDFESVVKYQVFFYAPNNIFMTNSELRDDVFTSDEIPLDAQYCRIVITPNEDDKISWYEKNGYANQLEIKVYKEQNYSQADLFALGTIHEGLIPAKGSDGKIQLDENASFNCVEIDVANMKGIKAIYSQPLLYSLSWMFADVNGNHLMTVDPTVGELTTEKAIPTGATSLYIIYKVGNEFVVNQTF